MVESQKEGSAFWLKLKMFVEHVQYNVLVGESREF